MMREVSGLSCKKMVNLKKRLTFQKGSALCLVNSDNERDSVLLNRFSLSIGLNFFLEGLAIISRTRLSNNRSVMPLDVLGRTRATLNESASFSLIERYG